MRRQLRRLTEYRHHEKPAVRVVTRRLIDIESLADFDAHIGKTRRLNGWFVQSVDLTERAGALLEVDPRGAVFLGCVFTPRPSKIIRTSGALLFPRLPDLPFDPYRGRAYDAVELYGTGDYATSLDAKVYTWAHTRARTRSQRSSVPPFMITPSRCTRRPDIAPGAAQHRRHHGRTHRRAHRRHLPRGGRARRERDRGGSYRALPAAALEQWRQRISEPT